MGDTTGAQENYFGKNDRAELERIAGRLATQRLYELESSAPLASFTRDDLCHVHGYLMQDIYPLGRAAPHRRGRCDGHGDVPGAVR